jgi:carbonic anhydrase
LSKGAFPALNAGAPMPRQPVTLRQNQTMISARDALKRLQEGNRRFVSSIGNGHSLTLGMRPLELATEQRPFAIVLGCSDARVPAEIVFDQGLGDLFVIRVAGNIVAPSQIGSVEFAASQFDTRLVVVLGHSECGAVLATLEQAQRPAEHQSPNLRSIVERIRPSVEALLKTELKRDVKKLILHAVRANISSSVAHLRHGSAILEELIRTEGLQVVGAEYSLETGAVTFFDDLSYPDDGRSTMDE